jgi:transposase
MLIIPLVTAHAPGLLKLYGVGTGTAAMLLIAAGDHPGRLRSEAAWAHLCAAAPIPASSGKVTRHRLNRGGDRQANHALDRVHPHGLRPGHPRLRRTPHQRREIQGRDHPLSHW